MLDRLIIELDKALRTIFSPAISVRPHPDANLPEAALDKMDKQHAIGLMRINHCGEVCAQALYQGQALTAHRKNTKKELQNASDEETEHLAWTAQRIHELGGKTSLFNPIWYIGSFAIGVTAGLLGDRQSLGFLEETENQVCAHLTSHLTKLPKQDVKSRTIIKKMIQDEKRHALLANRLGAAPLPKMAKFAMKKMAQIMTRSSYYF
ncbi:MAG: 2-polyprenyl-3-methyl-6-methoxy-1,4-benzoquinone monooxygenase [Neisseriales bacterium]|nr:MAG: 2-polyprenyl-3-methyl-6-methoxy-1,4-benzoquinone monooxygenase [Neisseriales bacterium]